MLWGWGCSMTSLPPYNVLAFDAVGMWSALFLWCDGCVLLYRQYHYVLQSLMLWREVSNDMFKLWYLAETDMLRQGTQYRLCDTGQGLNRVQVGPQSGCGSGWVDKCPLGIVQGMFSGVGCVLLSKRRAYWTSWALVLVISVDDI
jgi:hypothetical protein